MNIGQLIKGWRKEQIIDNASARNRYIPQKLYIKLKQEKRCRICNKKGILQIHHILPVREGGPNSKTNLIVVCKDCHSKIHAAVDGTFVIVDYEQFKEVMRQIWLYIKGEIKMRFRKCFGKQKKK